METHPLELFEIRNHIAQFLSKTSLLSCILVCHDWQGTFEPWLWNDVIVRWVSHNETKPPLQKLISNVHLMRRLEFKMGTLLLVVLKQLTCSHLRSLNMMVMTPKIVAPQIVLPEEKMILRHSSTLQELSLSLDPWRRDQTSIWRTIASCQRLEYLTLKQGRVRRNNWPSCWETWSRLRTLDLAVQFDDSIEEEDPPPWNTFEGCNLTRIEDMTFRVCKGMSNSGLLGFLRLCPNLKSLIFTQPEQGFNVGRLMELLVQCIQVHKGCPNLVSLTLNSELYKEEGLVDFLESRSEVGIEHLSLQNSTFGPTSWNVLKTGTNHFRTIRTLNLKGCLSVSKAIVQDMLCTLEGLEVFSATSLTNLELEQDPRPWVCRRLVSLTLALEVSSQSINFVFFERLAELENLRALYMGATAPPSSGLQPLRLRLDSGMGLLDKLARIEEISLQGSGHGIGYDENMFIKEHWPKFRCLLDWNGAHIPHWRRKKSKRTREKIV